jgi:hypothetical protein
MKRLKLAAKAVMALTVLGVVLAVALRPAPTWPAFAPDSAQRRQLFDRLVRDEPRNRTQALEDWAQHRWSQQDAFGALERDRVGALAREVGASPQDLFRVLDDGLRAGWPGPDGRPLLVRTVPLRPRPMD